MNISASMFVWRKEYSTSCRDDGLKVLKSERYGKRGLKFLFTNWKERRKGAKKEHSCANRLYLLLLHSSSKQEEVTLSPL